MLARLPRPILMLALAILAACSACAAPLDSASAGETSETTGTTQQAIVDGEDDDGDKAVVALLQNGKVYCTGVLITNNVVATAAHCVTPSPPEQIYFGSDPTKKKGTTIAVTTTRFHPDFDEDSLENDVAVVGLAQAAPVAPLTVVTTEFDESFVGREIRLVGFGATGPDATNNLRKRSGTTAITSYTDDDFRFRPAPAQTCLGDSGGPALAKVGDHEAIIGLTSSGDSNCSEYGRHMRIGRYLPFLQGYAKAYSIPTGPSSVESSGCSMSGGLPARSSSAAPLLLVLACFLVGRARSRRTTAP
jgi:secreted trypsin-like serine protease